MLEMDLYEAREDISELHEYLWRFCKTEIPFLEGMCYRLNDYLDVALEFAEWRAKNRRASESK
jgi:hypothetical protein